MYRRLIVLTTLISSLFGAQAAAAPPGKPLATLEEAGAYLAKISGKPLRPFSTRDFGRDEYAEAVSVLVDATVAESTAYTVRKHLGPGLVAYVGTQRSLATPKVKGVEVVIGHGKSQFDILRIAASDAVNYGMGTEDLIRQLQQWDAEFGIDIFQAETDTIQLKLKSKPHDPHGFAQAVYKFCPDIVDQGTGSVDQLEAAILESQQVYLWWD